MFTFKVSRFSFLPIRIWLSKFELRTLAARQRSHNKKVLKRIDLMSLHLNEVNVFLRNMVNMLWKHFGVS